VPSAAAFLSTTPISYDMIFRENFPKEQ